MMINRLCCLHPSASHSYDIEIAGGLLHDADGLMKSLSRHGSRFAIVSDEKIVSLYGEPLHRLLCGAGLEAVLFSFPSGEENKTRAVKENLEDRLFEKGFGRDSCVIVLGGGVAIDLGGYLAATYCRGIPHVIIPTSLLGMVDACIGGKTAVNVPYGKNMVGSIHQPKKVLIDPLVLRTLPLHEIRNGAVEMIKHGLIADPSLFEFLEQHCDQILGLDLPVLEQVIYQNCRIKMEIVEQDEMETGKRHLLNFGHTVGHALEKLTSYSISHGEAVAIGMLVESYLSVQMGHLSQHAFNKIQDIFSKYRLSLRLPFFSFDRILEAMRGDKKSRKGIPRFVILKEIGSPLPFESAYCGHVEEKFLKTSIDWMNDALCCH